MREDYHGHNRLNDWLGDAWEWVSSRSLECGMAFAAYAATCGMAVLLECRVGGLAGCEVGLTEVSNDPECAELASHVGFACLKDR